jgi:hypothetical protein
MDLPEDCLIHIVSFLDLLTLEIVYLKTASTFYNKLLRRKINMTVNKNISLIDESFFQKSVRYHIFQKKLLDKIKKSNCMYERDNIMMLLERNWL